MPPTWLGKIRARALWVVVCLGVMALGLIAWTTLPAWPVVGAAVTAVALVLNSITSKIDAPICLDCGADLSDEPVCSHGRICKSCGAINERVGVAERDEDSREA